MRLCFLTVIYGSRRKPRGGMMSFKRWSNTALCIEQLIHWIGMGRGARIACGEAIFETAGLSGAAKISEISSTKLGMVLRFLNLRESLDV